MLMKSRLLDKRVVHLGSRVVQLLNSFEPTSGHSGSDVSPSGAPG